MPDHLQGLFHGQGLLEGHSHGFAPGFGVQKGLGRRHKREDFSRHGRRPQNGFWWKAVQRPNYGVRYFKGARSAGTRRPWSSPIREALLVAWLVNGGCKSSDRRCAWLAGNRLHGGQIAEPWGCVARLWEKSRAGARGSLFISSRGWFGCLRGLALPIALSANGPLSRPGSGGLGRTGFS